MIKEVSYERVFSLGNYENHRISCTVTVENGDHLAAFAEARANVEAQHTIFEYDRQQEQRRREEEWARKRREQIDAIQRGNEDEDSDPIF